METPGNEEIMKKPSEKVTVLQSACVMPPAQMNWSGNLCENWKFFKQKFDIYLIASKSNLESSNYQVALLLNVIGDRSLKVFNNFVFANEEEKSNLASVLKKFDLYFMPDKNVTYERHKFFLREQGENEKIDQYVTELRDLSSTCEFGDISDSLIKDRIILGIKDLSIKDRLLRTKDLTLSKALDICRTAEITKSQLEVIVHDSTSPTDRIHAVRSVNNRRNRQYQSTTSDQTKMAVVPNRSSCSSSFQESKNNNYRRSQHYNPLIKINSKFVKSNNNKPKCNRCGYSHVNGSCPAIGKICNKCRKANHFASQCRKNRPIINMVQNEDEVENLFLGAVHSDNKLEWKVSLTLDDCINADFKIDSGAQANIINQSIIDFLGVDKNNLIQTSSLLTSYTGQKLDVLGKISLKTTHKNVSQMIDYFVVNSKKSQCILGLSSSISLNLIKKIDECNKMYVPNLLEEYGDLMKGIGNISGESEINVKSNISPVVHCPRKVPLALRQKLKNRLCELEKHGIIKKVQPNEVTEWVNSLVLVNKPNGDLRLCIDPKDLNEAIIRHPYPIPTFEEIVSKLSGATVFSTLDIRDGFWAIKLKEPSSKLCTFNTPFGRYRFLRLPYGLKCSSDIFQERMTNLLEGLEGIAVYIDDIICWGKDVNEHNERLKKLLNRLREQNVKLNKNKCKIAIKELSYLGHKLSAKGVTPDENKVKAITSMEAPTDKKSLERFLGLVNYIGKFIPNLSQHTTVLRGLLKKNVQFSWYGEHEAAFRSLKQMLVEKPVLQFFDINKPIVLSVDSSKDGIGAVLLQNSLPVAYASKALNDVQKNSYSQIEREMLAVLFGCERFHQFVFGQSFTIETDHKPLVSIVKKNFDLCPPRLQRMLLRLQPYDFKLVYKKGKELYIADTLSRCTNNLNRNTIDNFDLGLNSEEIEAQICSVVDNVNISEDQLNKIVKLTDVDEELKLLKHYLTDTWPVHRKQLPEIVRVYWNFRDELSLCKNLVLRGTAIVIPKCMRQEMLNRLHYSHCGINKTALKARGVIFWPGMYNEIENMILSCQTCICYSNNNPKEPLKQHPVPRLPWEKVGIDLFELEGKMYMLAIDYYSKYPEILLMQNITSSYVIEKLKQIFSRHGIPSVVFTDNGTQFTAQQFQDFSKSWGFVHKTSSPLFAQENGMVERAIQSIKNMIRKSLHSKHDLYLTLLEYRNTPISDKIPSPAEILFSRKLRGILPFKNNDLKPRVHTNVRKCLQDRQTVQKYYFDRKARVLSKLNKGEKVLVKVANDKWIKCIVIGYKHGNHGRSYILRNCITSQTYVRNRYHIKPLRIHVNKEEMSMYNNDDVYRARPFSCFVYKMPSFVNSSRPSCPKENNLNNRPSQSPKGRPNVEETLSTLSDKCQERDRSPVGSSHYVTRSGRSVKPPNILDL